MFLRYLLIFQHVFKFWNHWSLTCCFLTLKIDADKILFILLTLKIISYSGSTFNNFYEIEFTFAYNVKLTQEPLYFKFKISWINHLT